MVGVELLDGLDHPVGRREDRPHGTLLGQFGHQPAPECREPEPVLEAEDPRGLGRRDLPEAVPYDDIGADAEARPQGGQSALQGVDGGLRPTRIVELAARTGFAEHHREQGHAPQLLHSGVAPVKHGPHHRLGLVERPAHALPLAGLAGVDERDLGRGARRAHRVGRRELFQLLSQRRGVAEDQSGPVREVAAAGRSRPGHVGEHRVGSRRPRGDLSGILVEPRQVAPGQFAQGRR